MQAESMQAPSDSTNIQQYFASSTIFITGGTGFLGKLLIEKLFRTCPNITKVYLLLREIKGKTIYQRYEELLKFPIFDQLKSQNFNFSEKIVLVRGDTYLPNLGMSENDIKKLIDEVTCVFHCAATVRFDEKVRLAAYNNVRATRDLLVIAKQMKKLNSFVYISTAYSNCVYNEVKEQLYDSALSGEKFLQLVDSADDEFLENVKLTLIGKWPNTYTYSKSIAENFIKTEGEGLPIAVVRPSIVISTINEPFPGWIDNIYGPAGVLTGVGLGLIHSIKCIKTNLADVVPADLVVNCVISAAWDASNLKEQKISFNLKENTSTSPYPKIYNYVSSPQNPIIWDTFVNLSREHGLKIPSNLAIWCPFLIMNSSSFIHSMCLILLHQIPAYIVDFVAFAIGKQRRLVKGYKKIHKFLDVLGYFGVNEWNFRNENTQELWKKLSQQDQSLFDFNMENFDWNSYFITYVKGARQYLLKDTEDTIPSARRKFQIFRIAHYTLVTVLLCGTIFAMFSLYQMIF